MRKISTKIFFKSCLEIIFITVSICSYIHSEELFQSDPTTLSRLEYDDWASDFCKKRWNGLSSDEVIKQTNGLIHRLRNEVPTSKKAIFLVADLLCTFDDGFFNRDKSRTCSTSIKYLREISEAAKDREDIHIGILTLVVEVLDRPGGDRVLLKATVESLMFLEEKLILSQSRQYLRNRNRLGWIFLQEKNVSKADETFIRVAMFNFVEMIRPRTVDRGKPGPDDLSFLRDSVKEGVRGIFCTRRGKSRELEIIWKHIAPGLQIELEKEFEQAKSLDD